MKKLNISDDFNLDDIRKIRDYDYEMTKNMTEKLKNEYYEKQYEEAEKCFREVREKMKNENVKE